MKWGLLLAGIISLPALAQVPNNDIENRFALDLDKPVHSSTSGSDVQWKCINKQLTNKCLVYHNDQWFSFTVDRDGDYFINISSQQCRDSNGVQMIVIEGNPCQHLTYKILDCIPRIRTEDVFVGLPKLKSRTQYLVNVDGFLGDFCEFDIVLSDKPQGLPLAPQNLDTLKIESRLEDKVVSMEWTIDKEMAKDLSSFRIFRKVDKGPSNLAEEIGLARNAYGSHVSKYYFSDTLSAAGAYRYDIYGIRASDSMPLLLSQNQFSLAPKKEPASGQPVMKILPLRMSFPEKEPYQLRLYNYDGDQLLWSHEGESQGEGELFMIDPRPFLEYGVRKFQLLVLDSNGTTVQEIYFRVDGNSAVIKE
jgi:hypothetical protein